MATSTLPSNANDDDSGEELGALIYGWMRMARAAPAEEAERASSSSSAAVPSSHAPRESTRTASLCGENPQGQDFAVSSAKQPKRRSPRNRRPSRQAIKAAEVASSTTTLARHDGNDCRDRLPAPPPADEGTSPAVAPPPPAVVTTGEKPDLSGGEDE